MEAIKVDGVSYNANVIRKMSEKEFVNHEMHNNHLTHLSEEDKKAALIKAYMIIQHQKKQV